MSRKKAINDLRRTQNEYLKDIRSKEKQNGFSMSLDYLNLMNRFYESKLELEKLLDPSSKEIEECKERLTFWRDQLNFVKQNQLKFVPPQIDFRQLCSTMFPDFCYDITDTPSKKSERKSTSSKVSENKGIQRFCHSLLPWNFDFGREFDVFMSEYDREKLVDPIHITKSARKMREEFDVTTHLITPLDSFLDSVCKVSQGQGHELKYERTLGKADFTINCHDRLGFVQIKLDQKFNFGEDDKSIIDFYNDCKTHKGFGKCSHYVCKAIFEIYCYLANNNAQYGVLSTFERSWICKIDKDHIDDKVLPEMRITVAYGTSNLAPKLYKNIECHSFFEVVFVLFSLMHHKSNDHFRIGNFAVANSSDLSGFHIPDFYSLKVLASEQTFLGEGRCGQVFIGYLHGVKVAVKLAELSKMTRKKRKVIKEEMRNEAKILHYLNTHDYKYAPKLFYCGYWCGSLFFAIATRLIPGQHKRSREELSETEKKNLNEAIEKLHELNITHNDLKWNNVLFCEDDQSVFIIDYGFAKYSHKRSVCIEDEENYNLY